MPSLPAPPPLGKNIMALRKKRGLSLDELARRSGVSKAMLSQVEQQKTNPTVATLWKISLGLDADLEQLLGRRTGTTRTIETVRLGDAPVLPNRDGSCEIQVCSSLEMMEDLELYYLRFNRGGVLESGPHFPRTEEMATVIKGRFQIEADGEKVTLRAGDHARYLVDVAHAIRNIGRGAGEMFLVVRFHEESA